MGSSSVLPEWVPPFKEPEEESSIHEDFNDVNNNSEDSVGGGGFTYD